MRFRECPPSTDPPTAKQDPQTQPVANTSALPQEGPVIGAQLAGLAVLALAFLLAAARLSFRRRSAPAQSGPAGCLGDIGTHAYNIASFVSGLELESVSADLTSFVKGRKLDDNVHIMMRFKGGAKGMIWASQVAPGNENGLKLRVYGEKGLVDWSHREPSYLKLALQGEPVRTIGRGDAYLPPETIAAGRTPRGHPEGLREAFANIYAEIAQERIARELGDSGFEPAPYPRIDDGVHTMAFIEACLSSHASGRWADVAKA